MMQQELNVIKLKREMEQMLSKNAVNMKRLNEILETLRSTEIDLEILRKTKIGVCVNNVRKTFKNSKELAKSTAELIRKWKKIAKEEFRTKSESTDGIHESESANPNPNLNSPDDHPYAETIPAENSSSNTDSNSNSDSRRRNDANLSESESESDSDGEKPTKTREKMPKNLLRRKSIDLLEEALRVGGGEGEKSLPVGGEYLRIAVEVESHVFREHPDPNDKKYKARIRSRVMNLRDKNNPEFRRNVLEGDLKPAAVARMSVEEMASDRLKKLRQSIEEESMKEIEMKDPTVDLAKSSMFVCPSCGERDTSYTITQDRLEGEYEPIAVSLVLCNLCGHRWKHF